ncbi:hypothetical protein G6F50_014834 [Rhizopus delemar]|uniref:Uncharacterized protein n=1 Tax=Rhizopus delemar TaxID=936053 RepID=A0A9P7C5P9_9FUNG|nr:hypothetical protein G6F50_014834 [Rhizopus delemar]
MIESATFFKRKHWTLLAATVLAGCSTTAPRTGSEAPTPVTPPAATYAKAAWSALPPQLPPPEERRRLGQALRHRRRGIRQGPGRDPPVPATRP